MRKQVRTAKTKRTKKKERQQKQKTQASRKYMYILVIHIQGATTFHDVKSEEVCATCTRRLWSRSTVLVGARCGVYSGITVTAWHVQAYYRVYH